MQSTTNNNSRIRATIAVVLSVCLLTGPAVQKTHAQQISTGTKVAVSAAVAGAFLFVWWIVGKATGGVKSPPANVSVFPRQMDFGGISTGSSAKNVVTIVNGLKGPLAATKITVKGQGFSVEEMPSLPLRVDPGERLLLNVSYCPGKRGKSSGKLSIAYQEINTSKNGSLEIHLEGRGQP
ncbi:MAG: hypothetical protein JXA73_05040 [Acidobacteria bacterium]|nr:hypothetical protein [Acidobacteriota bacterium]